MKKFLAVALFLLPILNYANDNKDFYKFHFILKNVEGYDFKNPIGSNCATVDNVSRFTDQNIVVITVTFERHPGTDGNTQCNERAGDYVAYNNKKDNKKLSLGFDSGGKNVSIESNHHLDTDTKNVYVNLHNNEVSDLKGLS